MKERESDMNMQAEVRRVVRAPNTVDFRIFGNHLSSIVRETLRDANASLITNPDFTFGRELIEPWILRHACYDGATLDEILQGLIKGNVLKQIAGDTFQFTPDAIDAYKFALKAQEA